MVNVVVLSVASIDYYYAACRYNECHYVEYCYAVCHYTDCCYAECHFNNFMLCVVMLTIASLSAVNAVYCFS